MNTSFFLQAEGHSAGSTGDQSPIHRYTSSDDESDRQSDSDSQSLREDNSQSSDNYHNSDKDHNSDDNHDSDEDHASQHDNYISLYSEDSQSEWQSTSLKRKLPEEVQATPEKPKTVLCFSSFYYNVTDTNETRTYSTAQSSTTVLAANGQSIDVNIHLDTCGSRNLASEHLLHNITKAEEHEIFNPFDGLILHVT